MKFPRLLIFAALALSLGCTKKEEETKTEAPAAITATDSAKIVTEDLKVGTGTEVVADKNQDLKVHYVGKLTDGKQFDSSRDRGPKGGTPFEFKRGTGMVIKGWDEGLVGMKVGGLRKLTIPAEKGYGAQDMGAIPPNSTLVFEVELLEAK